MPQSKLVNPLFDFGFVYATVLGMGKKRFARPARAKATTADLVVGARLEKPVPSKWQANYRRLLELRNHLLSQRSVLARDALEEEPTFSSHMADAGTDTYDRDFALGLLSSEQDALYEIEEALARIRDGSYGICQLTGKEIEPARLVAIPWTRFTADAEKQLEREGEVRGARLGPRESVPKEKGSSAEEEEE